MSETTEVHFEGKIAQKAIIVKENRVLLLRDPRMEEVIWEIPGGRMNIDEEPREAVAREIREELGIEITVRPGCYTWNSLFREMKGSERLLLCMNAI